MAAFFVCAKSFLYQHSEKFVRAVPVSVGVSPLGAHIHIGDFVCCYVVLAPHPVVVVELQRRDRRRWCFVRVGRLQHCVAKAQEQLVDGLTCAYAKSRIVQMFGSSCAVGFVVHQRFQRLHQLVFGENVQGQRLLCEIVCEIVDNLTKEHKLLLGRADTRVGKHQTFVYVVAEQILSGVDVMSSPNVDSVRDKVGLLCVQMTARRQEQDGCVFQDTEWVFVCDGWKIDETYVGIGVGTVHTTLDFVPERRECFGGIVQQALHTFNHILYTLTEPQVDQAVLLAVYIQHIFFVVNHRADDSHKK